MSQPFQQLSGPTPVPNHWSLELHFAYKPLDITCGYLLSSDISLGSIFTNVRTRDGGDGESVRG